ncbi:MAG: alpha/beta fold hydrolase [Vulcanimicrobiota bacterium]
MMARQAGLLLLGCMAGCARPPAGQAEYYEVARPRWSRRGDLAYLSDESGSWRCQVLRSDGRQQVAPIANVTLAAWQPRQLNLALQYDPDGSESSQIVEWNLQDGQLRPLAVGPGVIHHFGTFSRSGRLAYSANSRSAADFDIEVEGEAGLPRSGYNVPLRFSPDGRGLLFYSQGASLDQQLFELDLKRGSCRPLTSGSAGSLYLSPTYLSRGRLWMLSNLDSDYLGLVEWRRGRGFRALWRCQADIEDWAYEKKSGTLAFSINQRGYSALQIVPPRPYRGVPPGVYSQLSFRPDGSLGFHVDGPAQPGSVWKIPPGGGSAQKLLGEPGLPQLRAWPTPVRFKSSDGLEIGGLLSTPERPRAGLLVLHGGPASQARPTFSPLYQNLVGRGVAVLQLDVRGSTGYGRKYAALDDGAGRLGAVLDVEAGAAFLRSRGVERLGLMGHSYGGYLAWLAAERNPKAWSCLVIGSAISDLTSYYQTTASWRLGNRLAEYGQPGPGEWSPLRQVGRLQMPVLLYHGRRDSRVPVAQGESMAAALRAQGNRLQWLEFPDEGHHLMGRANRRLLSQRVELFLQSELGL